MPAAGTATVARNYHSTALLMPDGRVWTAGGNDRGDWSYHNSAAYENPPKPLPTDAQDPGVDNRETQIELFEPPYYGQPDRPRITSAPAYVGYNRSFTIQTPDAGAINRVALIRAGSATHAFNGDQRYVGLTFTRGAGQVVAIGPPRQALGQRLREVAMAQRLDLHRDFAARRGAHDDDAVILVGQVARQVVGQRPEPADAATGPLHGGGVAGVEHHDHRTPSVPYKVETRREFHMGGSFFRG
jgi:hypothetical protein